MADIEMPQLGETVTEGTITRWFKQEGDHVDEDEVLFEVSTDKVDSEVPSPASGTLVEILVPEGDTVEVGTVLARVSDGETATASAEERAEPAGPPEDDGAEEPAPAEPPVAAEPPAAPEETSPPSPPSAPSAAPPAAVAPGVVLSPVVRRLIAEHDLDVSQLQGTGEGGRITRGDVQRAIESGVARAREGGSQGAAAPASAPSGPAPRARTGDVTEALNNIRRRTGEHMQRSRAEAPHAVTAVEVDFEAVERVRRAHGARWQEEEGFTLTYLPFIARAVIDALRDYPHVNASVGNGELIVHHYVNLAIAVDLDFEGLIAPVVRDADEKRLRALAREIRDLADRARSKQLSPDEIAGGTFTITNAGSYGTHMVIPIINQPQVAILSTDGISRKPVVVTDESGGEAIAIHSVGLLPMSWDHRAFDGAYSAAFLARVREILETRDWEAEL